MFNSLDIKQFRCFSDHNIILGKYLTVLAGRNSTGKSTVLGMLGNAAELKKRDGSTYFSKSFRADFGELFKGSETYDLTGSDKYKVTITDDEGQEIDYRQFRVTWQKKSKDSKEKRFRIIPYKYNNKDSKKKTDTKLDIPVYYLGLSRLFPIGEAKDDSIKATNLRFNKPEHEQWFTEKYKSILSLHEEISSVSGASLGETENKKAVGINTDLYDYKANSSGQDNVGQILFALLSFRKIAETITPWRGGLLLIDEFDSTLHPAAQNRLIDIMLAEARDLKIQIAITTHSISLLKHITEKTAYNNPNGANNVELYYFTNSNRALEIKRNVEFSIIEGDLLVQSAVQNRKKIKVYSEDAETRWFFKNLISDYQNLLEILDVALGCRELMTLFKADMVYFGNTLIVLDGDVEETTLNVVDSHTRDRVGNIIKLPCDIRPEQVIYDYLVHLPSDHPYWAAGATLGFTWDYFNDNGPMSSQYQGNDREKYKKWFLLHQPDFDTTRLYAFWAEDNPNEVNQFKGAFINAYNKVADRISIPRIQP